MHFGVSRIRPAAAGTTHFGISRDGDWNELFGGFIPTTILLTIGALGWTFEALCVEMATGHNRRVVKKAMRRLEDEGVLQGDRPRRPGMNVRVVTIAEGFPARDELQALLESAARARDGFVTKVHDQMNRFTPKTRAHLRLRGLWL